MKQRRRIYYTETQKALMWERWRKGDTLAQIARLFELGSGRLNGELKWLFMAEHGNPALAAPAAASDFRTRLQLGLVRSDAADASRPRKRVGARL